MFSSFLGNLAITNSETISNRYGELTAALNKRFRDTESKTAYTLQVGSYGRRTGIEGISDLDMLYIMPKSSWNTYKDNRQLKLLQDVKDAILKRYPKTNVRVDRLVVTVTYTNFHVEVQPVFEQEDQSYKYPDTKNGGDWKITKPRAEMDAMATLDSAKNANLRRLCKMGRAWKNKHGVGMGGLLVDTLAYNFLRATEAYDNKSYLYYDQLNRDFFEYLSNLPKQDRYSAPGSGQHVTVKKSFQRKAKKAYNLCLKAIDAQEKGEKGVHQKWKKIFGRPFPASAVEVKEASIANAADGWNNTEQFIEDQFQIDVKEFLSIDCEVKQHGFREFFLRHMLSSKIPLKANKKLHFRITRTSVEEPYDVYWKVLNRGEIAKRRNCVRGQIVADRGNHKKSESTSFRGDHVVECYAVKDNVVVAKDRIHVPISTNDRSYE